MRVISRKPLAQFAATHPDAKTALDAWFHEVEAADWAAPTDIKELYAAASVLKAGRVVFNICGNKYRLVARVNYEYRIVYVRFVGTHARYDEIDPEKV